MPTWLLWALIGIVFAIGAALFIKSLLSEEEEEDETAEGYEGGDTTQVIGGRGDTLSETLSTTSEEYQGARKSRMIALKESLEASLEARPGAESPSDKDRMSMPWFMLLGGEGSGKTTLLANTGLPLPYGPAFEVDSRKKDAGRWWLYEDAVVLEAPAAAPGATATGTTLTPEQTQALNTSEGWNTLLHMLRRERPDSPLNGIIVTVSAPDLLASRRDPEKLVDQAERIRVFLERTRGVLGVRLPLHLLVTKCDTLPGFKSFAQNLPEGRRHDIFGWANPNKLETPFNPDWVDLGIAAMRDQLDDLRDELLAAPDEIVDSDGLFVFVSEFAELHEPLKEFATKLIGEGERRPSLFFRGMYFSGDAIEKVDAADLAQERVSGPRATVRISSEAAMGGQTTGHNLVFLRSLFRDKIFKEAGLAKPVARFRLSRDRRVVIAQAAALVFLLVGGAGLWTALNGYRRGETLRPGLRHDAEAVATVLAGMAIDIDEVKRGAGGPDSTMDRRLRDAAVIELVGEMRSVESIRKSPFIPASWFSPLPEEIRRSMVAGIESIVLPVSRQRLQERIDRLLGPAGRDSAAPAGDFASSDPRSLTEYLNEVKALSRNIGRYNTLATRDSGTVAQLAALLDYLYAERPLEGDSNFTSADFQSALRQASAARIVVTPAMARAVVSRSVEMIAAVARTSAQQLAPRETPAAARAVKPEDDLQALRGLSALVDLSDPTTGLIGTVSDSVILGLKLARIVQDSIAAELRLAAIRIGRDTVAPATAEARLRDAIARLFDLRFMERGDDREVAGDIQPKERLRWDVGRLELALALRGEFDQALFTVAPAFPGQPPDRMRRAFQVQLRSRAVDVAASAQRFTPMAVSDSALEVRTSAANLELAAPRILRASVLLDTLGAETEGRKLLSAASRQAEQAIAMTQAMFESRRFFEPHTARIAGWLGAVPLKFAALNIVNNDSLVAETTLLRYVSDIWTLSRDVQPAVAYLRRSGVDSARIPRLLADWENIGVQVGRWERGELATSTIGQLHRFVRDDMSVRDMETCAAAAAATDTIKASTDVFVIKRRQYRAAMAARCANAGPEAVAAYGRLRAAFASRLAGRYPFADSSRAGTSNVEVAALREWLRQYDTFVETGHDVALRSDPRLAGPAREAVGFLDQAARVRQFFSPVAESERRPPEYALVIGEGEGARVERWVYGQPITLLSAVEDSVGNRPEVTVAGPWSALLAARRRGLESVTIHPPDTKQQLGIPACPVTAPAIQGPRAR